MSLINPRTNAVSSSSLVWLPCYSVYHSPWKSSSRLAGQKFPPLLYLLKASEDDWGVAPCRLVEVYRRPRGACCHGQEFLRLLWRHKVYKSLMLVPILSQANLSKILCSISSILVSNGERFWLSSKSVPGGPPLVVCLQLIILLNLVL
jgi:hypothetical protein